MADVMHAKLVGVEIRGVERKEGRKQEDGTRRPDFLIVRVEDDAGNRHELIDRDVENFERYKRGTWCDVDIAIKYGNYGKNGWCRFELKSFKITA